MNFPGAIIFVNTDLTPGVSGPLVRQLYISETISANEFDLRISEDPNYPQIVHGNNLRVLVLRDLSDGYNRVLADVVIFIKAGLASILSTKFGPPGETLPVDKLTIYELLMKYPISGTQPIPGNVQNNILVPLFPHKNDVKLYPFGSDASIRNGGRGADIIIDEDE